MTMVRITPLEVSVSCNWFDGRPRRVRLGRDDQPVLAIERLREESAAYPTAIGPRTLFQVRTPASRLALAYRHRDGRWLVEALDLDIGARPTA